MTIPWLYNRTTIQRVSMSKQSLWNFTFPVKLPFIDIRVKLKQVMAKVSDNTWLEEKIWKRPSKVFGDLIGYHYQHRHQLFDKTKCDDWQDKTMKCHQNEGRWCLNRGPSDISQCRYVLLFYSHCLLISSLISQLPNKQTELSIHSV